jgi:hypothetical protein
LSRSPLGGYKSLCSKNLLEQHKEAICYDYSFLLMTKFGVPHPITESRTGVPTSYVQSGIVLTPTDFERVWKRLDCIYQFLNLTDIDLFISTNLRRRTKDRSRTPPLPNARGSKNLRRRMKDRWTSSSSPSTGRDNYEAVSRQTAR